MLLLLKHNVTQFCIIEKGHIKIKIIIRQSEQSLLNTATNTCRSIQCTQISNGYIQYKSISTEPHPNINSTLYYYYSILPHTNTATIHMYIHANIMPILQHVHVAHTNYYTVNREYLVLQNFHAILIRPF